MRLQRFCGVSLFFVVACGSPPEPQKPVTPPPVASASASAAVAELPTPKPAPAAERLSENTRRSTAGGTTFTAPGGWSVLTEGPLIVLESPEPDSHVALVDVQAADADAAVSAAWAAYRPGTKRPLKIATPRPARKGWDERRIYTYETSPNERAVVYAAALRKDDRWTVMIVDASEMTFERRLAQLVLVDDTIRPRGYVPESFAGKKANPLDKTRIKLITDFVEKAMAELGIPGAAVALVDQGKVVFEGGFGVRELGKPKKVDADTQFAIASNTKGMATLLLAELVDEGKLGWDTPVTKVYPGFKLGDADTTSKVLIKHLVCACTGLPRQDLEWIYEYGKATPQSTMELLGTMQPTSKFGETFQYSNILAAAAGFVGGHLLYPKRELGAAFDEAMRKRIFDPLGMKGATFDIARVERGNHARPHDDDIDGKPAVAKMDLNHSIDAARPAGGAWMSVHDLTKYVQLELARGKLPNGKQLVSEAALLARRAPQVPIGADVTYGMGLEVDTTWGAPVVHHGGSLFGYKSDWLIAPEQGIGAVILTNSDTGGLLLRPFLRRVLEVAFDGKPEAAEDVTVRAKNKAAATAKVRERLVVPADPDAVAKLAPRYRSPALGEVRVKKEGTTTIFDFGEFQTTMASRKNDDGTTSFITITPTFNGEDFVVGAREGKRVLLVRDAQHEYVLTEVPLAPMPLGARP